MTDEAALRLLVIDGRAGRGGALEAAAAKMSFAEIERRTAALEDPLERAQQLAFEAMDRFAELPLIFAKTEAALELDPANLDARRTLIWIRNHRTDLTADAYRQIDLDFVALGAEARTAVDAALTDLPRAASAWDDVMLRPALRSIADAVTAANRLDDLETSFDHGPALLAADPADHLCKAPCAVEIDRPPTVGGHREPQSRLRNEGLSPREQARHELAVLTRDVAHRRVLGVEDQERPGTGTDRATETETEAECESAPPQKRAVQVRIFLISGRTDRTVGAAATWERTAGRAFLDTKGPYFSGP